MPNFSFLVCLEVVVLWLETTKKQNNNKKNLVELEASLAPAKAEVGAVAKADQYIFLLVASDMHSNFHTNLETGMTFKEFFLYFTESMFLHKL